MRCNIGVPPRVLADQHLIAEYRELQMVLGSLRVNDYQIKSSILVDFSLGKGHINFFKNKLIYLKRRHDDIKTEMCKRGFKHNGVNLNIHEAPIIYHNDWTPSLVESNIIRQRLKEKLLMKPSFYKHYRQKIADMNQFIDNIEKAELWRT